MFQEELNEGVETQMLRSVSACSIDLRPQLRHQTLSGEERGRERRLGKERCHRRSSSWVPYRRAPFMFAAVCYLSQHLATGIPAPGYRGGVLEIGAQALESERILFPPCPATY